MEVCKLNLNFLTLKFKIIFVGTEINIPIKTRSLAKKIPKNKYYLWEKFKWKKKNNYIKYLRVNKKLTTSCNTRIEESCTYFAYITNSKILFDHLNFKWHKIPNDINSIRKILLFINLQKAKVVLEPIHLLRKPLFSLACFHHINEK